LSPPPTAPPPRHPPPLHDALPISSIDLPDPEQEAACTVVLLELHREDAAPIVLQVPLVATASWPLHRGVIARLGPEEVLVDGPQDRKSTRLNSSHVSISYAVFCLT